MAIPISASIIQINPETLFNDGFELTDQNIIPSQELVGSFIPEKNKIEFYIYDANISLLNSNYDFRNWSITQNSSTTTLTSTDTIGLDPSKDVFDSGFDIGNLYAVYNFINPELNSNLSQTYYISDISSNRTELRLKSNFITNEQISSSFTEFSTKLNNPAYFDEFYISFGNNEYQIGVNAQLETSGSQYSVLIKLYDALPDQYQVKDEVYVVTKVAESKAYQVSFEDTPFSLDTLTYLQGPNTNLNIKDFVNNSTTLKSKSDLLYSPSTSSVFNLQNVLNQKGVQITPNYSYDTFDEFVNFSSAKKRIENFVEKVSQIQTYQSDINALGSISGSTSSSYSVSSSVTSLTTNIENIIQNFDGYEYYLYYTTSSYSYPKSTSLYPYNLYPVNSSQVLTWLGSDVETSPYYGGIILSASFYDNNNQNWLYYTIPEFIRDNGNNNQYIEFCNMVGQHFDELWLYTKTITQKLNSTNNLEDGVPLKLAEEVIRSFGFEGYGNNYNNQDNFIGLVGEDNGTYVPPTGSELITNYIAVNQNIITNFSPNFTYNGYFQQLILNGYPYPIDNVSKEIFKRLYHNMAYLVKKKGTISGLRQLINIWGVPSTILRINEFGGKDQNESTYDQWYNRYSYAYTPSNTSTAVFPWMPLNQNFISESKYIVPDSIEFRFKTDGIPTSSYYTQSLLVKKSDGLSTSTNFDFGVTLNYAPITTGSYQGSYNTDYANYGTLRLYISGSAANGGTAVSNAIYLPFFDEGWWSVMLKRNTHVSASDSGSATTYTLYAKNKIYNGWDGNIIGFQGSASIVSNVSASINQAWNKFGTGSNDGIYLGGYISGSVVGNKTLTSAGKIFLGALQEFRYYSIPLTEEIFNNFTMNPESIEGINPTGSLSSFDKLNFRAPLGNELESTFTTTQTSSYTQSFTSLHPAISAESPLLITQSFINPVTNVSSSTYNLIYYSIDGTKTYSTVNREVYFLNQPAMGIRNVINDKIRITDTSDFGNVLSNQISIQQDYQISQSYTEDINSLEVSFSPQDEINDDIIQSLGFSNIQEVFSDPRTIRSIGDFYNPLRKLSEDYFKKYTKGNIYDYLRLIKYFDNSLFKAIKGYVPARTSLSTGIVIKQHLLERNKYQEPTLTQNTTIAYGSDPAFNTPLVYQNLELTSSIEMESISGGTGGVVEKFNYAGSPNFFQTPISQSWINSIDTIAGLQNIVENTEKEFYDGEYSGSEFIATTQNLFPNPYAPSNGLYVGATSSFATYFLSGTSDIIITSASFTSTFSPIPPSSPKLSNLNVNSTNFIIWDSNRNSIVFDPIEPSSSLLNFTIQATFISGDNTTLIGLKTIISSSQNGNRTPTTVFDSLSLSTSSFTRSFDISVQPGEELFIYTLPTPQYFTSATASFQLNINVTSSQVSYSIPFGLDPILFYNSDYYAIPNNENANRDNTFLKDVDYSSNPNYPVNRLAIISGSATPAQTPDSNYTTARIINPRYEGSRVSSADYNFYTAPTNSASFQNGDTGSWGGDISYGKTATIDKNPIYFAHFKTSKQSREYWNTYTFEIDALIESPRDSVIGENQETSVIKIEGQNNKLLDVSSTFEKNRQVSVNYENRVFSGNEVQVELDYSNQNQIVPIFQGASEFKLIGGNETGLRTAVTKSGFSMPTWLKANNSNPPIIFTNSTNCLRTGSGTLQLFSKPDNSGITLQTSAFDRLPFFGLVTTNTTASNNLLGLIHGYNYAVKNQIQGRFDFVTAIFNDPGYTVGLPYNTKVDPTDPSNYFNFIPISSSLASYENSNLPFLVERGDEIRVTYTGSLSPPNTSLSYFTQDFTVTNVIQYSDPSLIASSGSRVYSCSISTGPAAISIYDTFQVYPDPSTLTNNIPDGTILNYTIRRKADNDQSIIVFQSSPPNDQGYQTLSGPGYLIPNDFTEIQTRNALTLINNLKAKNAFRDDNDISLSI
jgi:hypothetical protein